MTAPLADGVLGVALFVGLAQVYARFILQRPPPVPHVLVLWMLVAIAVVTAALASSVAHPIVWAATNLSIYLLGGETYLFVYAASVGSLSVRIMVEMLDLEPAPDALQRAIARYPPAAFFDIRLQSLQAQRLLTETGGRYRVTAKGRRWVQYGVSLKRALGVGVGG